jgi:putative aldouronate transport system substrate-binding protein
MKKDLKVLKKKVNMKKITAKTMITFFLCSSVLTGCGADNAASSATSGNLDDARYTIDENTPAWKLDTQENTKLTWYVNAEWWNTDYGNDTVTKKIKEDLKLDIEFKSGDDTKLNTYFAGDEMPDIITIFGGNSSTALKANSWALSLQDLADKYDPYFYKVAKDQSISWYKLSDGKTYGYPSFSNTQEDYDSGLIPGNDAFIIREDIYTAIGEPEMSTPDEFLSALKMIKEKYPDITPFGFRGFGDNGDTGSLGKTLQDYLGVDISTEDNTFYNRNLDEDYLSWIKVINEAYKLGLISEDNFSDDNTIFEEKVASGKYATMLISGTAQLASTLQKNITQDSSKKYIAVDGPSTSKEAALTQTGLSGWSVTYISKSCKDPQKAIQLFTYLLDEPGQFLCNYGIEGETYEINAEGKAELIPEIKELATENPDEYKTQYRLGEFWFFGNDGFKLKNGALVVADSISQMVEWADGKVKPQFIIENIDPDQGTAEARNLTNINVNWATTLASLLRAKDDAEFDGIVAAYEKFLEENDFEAIVEVRNEKMMENLEKLDLE